MAAEGFTRLMYEIQQARGGVTKLTVTHDVSGAPKLTAMFAGEGESTGAGGSWSEVSAVSRRCWRSEFSCLSKAVRRRNEPSLERESFMAIVNALAGIMVSDLTTAEAWYQQLLSRPADARPMEGLAEWKLADGGWIQVFQDTERAGLSSVTFLVSGLDDQLAELKAKGISIERTTTSDYVKTATVTDPAGNRVVFAELTGQH